MARVSSESTEAAITPGMVPFDWEAAPGRPGRMSSGIQAGRYSLDVPSLPFPPGRRPEDFPDLQTGRRASTSSRPRKLFNLKLPGSSKKAKENAKEEEDPRFSIFNPVSGSSITRRLLASLTKKQSLWTRCLPSTPGQMRPEHQSKGRRLDSVDEEYGDSAPGESLSSSPDHGLSSSLPVVTKNVQPSNNSSPQMTFLKTASPGHANRQSSNSSPKQFLQPPSPGYGRHRSSNSSPRQLLQPSSPAHSNSFPFVRKQVQVASSRFMASMLISLCPEDDEPRFDAEDEIADNRSSSPQVLHEMQAKPSECAEIVVDPASQTGLSHEECRCTCKHREQVVDPRKQRNVSRSLHEELATAQTSSPSLRSGRKLVQQHASASDQSNEDKYPVFPKSFPVRRKEPYHSSFSWKPCTEMSRDPAADSDQDRGDSEFAKEIFEVDVPRERSHERRGGFSSNSSSSSESNSVASSRPNPSIRKNITPKSKHCDAAAPPSMVGFLSPPRTSSSGELEHSSNKPKAFVRWKSAVEPRELGSPDGRAARIQQPTARTTVSFLSPPRSKTRTKQILIQSPKAHHGDDDTDESESERSTDSSQCNRVPRSASPKPSRSQSLFEFQQSHCESTMPEVAALPGPSFKQVLTARRHSVRSSSSRLFTPEDSSAESNLPPVSRLAKTSSTVMRKVAEWEAKAGEGSTKSGPLYQFNRRAVSAARP